MTRAAKRVLDLLGAAAGLVLAAVPMAVIAVAIRATIGRPVLFRQQRPGRNEVLFTLVKFRTMTAGASDRADSDPALDVERLTRLGRFLRRTSLDELPSLANVLRGELSLVGPRPLLTRYLDRYTGDQRRRHDVRPGLTGLAQVKGRNDLRWQEQFELDVWYVDHWSLRLDLRILARSVGLVVRGKGVSEAGRATRDEFRG